MKSLQVQYCISPKDRDDYSDLQVLKSAAGWYVGTIYTHTHPDGTVSVEPGSRDTPYTGRQKTADLWLLLIEETAREHSDMPPVEKAQLINEKIGGDFQYRLTP